MGVGGLVMVILSEYYYPVACYPLSTQQHITYKSYAYCLTFNCPQCKKKWFNTEFIKALHKYMYAALNLISSMENKQWKNLLNANYYLKKGSPMNNNVCCVFRINYNCGDLHTHTYIYHPFS